MSDTEMHIFHTGPPSRASSGLAGPAPDPSQGGEVTELVRGNGGEARVRAS